MCKALITVVLLSILFTSSPAYSCSYEADRKVMKQGVKDRQKMKKIIRELKKRSDNVFVGRVSLVDKNTAIFKSVENIKGLAKPNEKYWWKNDTLEEIGCGGLTSPEFVRIEQGNGFEYYLIYSDNQKIIRAVRMNYNASSPNPHEEVDWVN